MKMYKSDDAYTAIDSRGRVAPADADSDMVRSMWAEPETFLRLAHMFTWMEAGSLTAKYAEERKGALVWEREDPHYTAYKCGDLLVVADGVGHFAPVSDASDTNGSWRDPEKFLLQNSRGNVLWTHQGPGGEAEEQHYARMVSDCGAVLWTRP